MTTLATPNNFSTRSTDTHETTGVIHCDATFDKRTGESFYGYCNSICSIKFVSTGIFPDINAAEVAAVQLALDHLRAEDYAYDYCTDSAHAVRHFGLTELSHIRRDKNMADAVVNMAKESRRTSSLNGNKILRLN